MLSFRNNKYTSPSSLKFSPTLSKYYVTCGDTTIETTVTDRTAIASSWTEEVTHLYGGRTAVVGLDIEWLPNNVTSMSNRAAALKLCIDNKCLILQLFYMDNIPDSVSDLLMNPNFTFVGVGVEKDVEKLKNEYRIDCRSHLDVRAASINLWPWMCRNSRFNVPAHELCGLYIENPRGVWLGYWGARTLSDAQIEYACIDAFACYKIGHKLLIEMGLTFRKIGRKLVCKVPYDFGGVKN